MPCHDHHHDNENTPTTMPTPDARPPSPPPTPPLAAPQQDNCPTGATGWWGGVVRGVRGRLLLRGLKSNKALRE